MEDQKYSFFIGRFQPLHAGHLVMFDKVRKEGKKIAVGIMDTIKSEKNPYSLYERIKMFCEDAPDIRIYTVPPIDEVCYGRDVGYGIRQIHLPPEIEKISATEIRGKIKRINAIGLSFWLFRRSYQNGLIRLQ